MLFANCGWSGTVECWWDDTRMCVKLTEDIPSLPWTHLYPVNLYLIMNNATRLIRRGLTEEDINPFTTKYLAGHQLGVQQEFESGIITHITAKLRRWGWIMGISLSHRLTSPTLNNKSITTTILMLNYKYFINSFQIYILFLFQSARASRVVSAWSC